MYQCELIFFLFSLSLAHTITFLHTQTSVKCKIQALCNKKEDMIQLGDGAWGANWTPQNFIFITTFTYNVIPKICVYRLLHDPQ